MHDVAERFAELGLDLPAAVVAADAAHGFEGKHDQRSARRARALSNKHASLCHGVVAPALALTDARDVLTPRERDVALLAAAGRTNTEIADELVLSVRTVKTYVLRACHKLGVTRRTDLAGVLTSGR